MTVPESFQELVATSAVNALTACEGTGSLRRTEPSGSGRQGSADLPEGSRASLRSQRSGRKLTSARLTVAGIIHQHVDWPRQAFGLGDSRRDRVEIGHIQHERWARSGGSTAKASASLSRRTVPIT